MRMLAFSIIVFLISCSVPRAGYFSAAFYNAYAFFDSSEDGWEYDGFRKSDGYTEEAYKERVRKTAVFLAKNTDCDLLILSEIESEEVLVDLISEGLDTRGFRYYGLAASGEPLSVGFISKSDVRMALHSADGTRPFVELEVQTDQGPFTIFGVHMRSRLEEGSERVREKQMSHLANLLASAASPAIAIGDFNADPDHPEAGMARFPASASIMVTDDPGRIGGNAYYSPFSDRSECSEEGTYCYEGQWYFFDNALLGAECFDLDGWDYHSAEVIRSFEAEDILFRPEAYDASTGRGYSDHFPIEVRFISRL